jgi:inosine/xanthosine triphosphate pyrophosphatase family protein
MSSQYLQSTSYQQVEKPLRKEERISIAPVSVILTSCAGMHQDSRQCRIIKGEERDQISQLHSVFQQTLQSQHSRIVNLNLLTDGQRGDIGNDIIGATYLKALRSDPRFSDCNLCVQVLENPYTVSVTSRVPNDTARSIWEGALSFLSGQNNMLGLCGTRGILAVSLQISADCNFEQNVLTTTATPGEIQYEKRMDMHGNRLIGRDLTNSTMTRYNGQQVFVTANCYGLTQRPDTLDKDGMLQTRLPNVCSGFYDKVFVNTSSNYGVVPNDYHGVLMGLGVLSNQFGQQYGLEQDGQMLLFGQGTALYKCALDAISQIEIPAKYSLRAGFLSTSIKKTNEVKKMAGDNLSYMNEKWGRKLSKFSIEVYRIQFHKMPEKQSMDPVDVIEDKVDDLRFKLDQLSSLIGLDFVFNDDTSFEVDALNREPSTLYRTMYDKMLNMERDTTLSKYAYDTKDVAVGYNYNNYLCNKVSSEIAKNNSLTRECSAITIFGVHVTTGYGTVVDTILRGLVRGVVPDVPSGDREFGWDTVFDFVTYTDEFGTTYNSGGRTYASMTDTELAKVKPRAIAMRKALGEKLAYISGNFTGTETYVTQSEQDLKATQSKIEAKVNIFTDLFKSGQIQATQTQQGAKVSGATINASNSNMAAIMAAFA